MLRLLFLAGVYSSVARSVEASGYDYGGTDPICWKTTNVGTEEQTKVQLASCPTGLSLNFEVVPPDVMYENKEYAISYVLRVDQSSPETVGLMPYSALDIPHSNIHSCFASVGFCTPFISNDGETATHTPEMSGAWSVNNDKQHENYVTFDLNIRLSQASYTIIAHGRFYTDEGLECDTISGNGCTKWDVANAIIGQRVLGAENELVISDSLIILSLVVAGIAELLLLSLLGVVLQHYDTKVMRFSQRQILIAMILCGMLSVGATPFMVSDVTDTICAARGWVIAVPLVTMFNLLLAKTARVWKLFANQKLKRLVVKQSQVVIGTVVLTSPLVFMLVLQQLLDTPRAQRVNSEINETDFAIECVQDQQDIWLAIMVVYVLGLMGTGCYLAHATSGTTTLFNESKYIGFSMYNMALLGVVCIPLLLVIKQQPDLSFLIFLFCVVISACSTCCSLIVPKYLMLKHGDAVDLATSAGNDQTTTSTGASASRGTKVSGSSVVYVSPAAGGAADDVKKAVQFDNILKAGTLSGKVLRSLKSVHEAYGAILRNAAAGVKVDEGHIEAARLEGENAAAFMKQCRCV